MRTPAPIIRTPTAMQRKAPMAIKPRPPLRMMVERADDPVGDLAAPENDIEAQSGEIYAKIKTAYDDREQQLTREAKHATPHGFYLVMVFSTTEQAMACAQALGEQPDTQYLDGRRVCDRLNIAIPPDVWDAMKRQTTPDKRLAALALPIKKEG